MHIHREVSHFFLVFYMTNMQDLNNGVEYLENAINQVDLINIIEHNI